MVVSLCAISLPYEGQNNCTKDNDMTVETLIVDIKSCIHYEPIENLVVEVIENTNKNAIEKMDSEINRINCIDDKKEWFITYKNIAREYENYFDPPETIYDCFSEKELILLFHVVQAEIGDKYSFEQKVNVASVIFNRIKHERFPNSLSGILVANQFATISDGRYKEVEVSEETVLACEYAFQIEDTTGGCLFFDSNNRLNYRFMFFDGAHNFYTLKGEEKEGGDLILLQE